MQHMSQAVLVLQCLQRFAASHHACDTLLAVPGALGRLFAAMQCGEEHVAFEASRLLLRCLSPHTSRVGAGALLCCAVLCCVVLCCAVLCCAVLCCVVLCDMFASYTVAWGERCVWVGGWYSPNRGTSQNPATTLFLIPCVV
jgi:hypothetical protein